MAYTVSTDYNNIIYSGNARNKLKILFNNVEIQDVDNFCEKLTLKSRIIADDGSKCFSLNNFIAKEVELILRDIDIDDIQDQVNISIGTLVNNAYEYVPIGIFNIQDTPTSDNGRTIIKLRDNAVKFDFDYNAFPLIEENGGTATKKQILDDICEQAGVTCNVSSFLGDSDEIGIYDSTITARIYIADIAEQAGAIATINRSGELIFIYLNNLTTKTIPLDIIEKYTIGTEYTIGKVEFETAITKFTAGSSDDYLYLDSSNPYISNQTQINNIYTLVNGFSINSLSTGRIIGNPSIDCYDLISITDNDSIYITLANYQLTYTGIMTMQFDTNIGLEEKKNNVTINSEATFRNWTKTEIDNVDASIRLLAGKTQVVSNELDGIGQITLQNAQKTALYRLSIRGDISLIYPSSTLYPSPTLYPKSNILLVDDKEYKLDLNYLRFTNQNLYDEFIYENGKCYIIRRDESNGEIEETIEERKSVLIEVDKNSVIKLKSFNNALLKANYLLKNEFTDVFANSIETSSKFELTDNKIEQSLEAVADTTGRITATSIVQAINNGESSTDISADKINFNGHDFNVTTDRMKITIGRGENAKDIINANGVLTNLIFNGEMWGWTFENGYDGQQAGFVGYNTDQTFETMIAHQSFLNFSVRIPKNFVVTSAKIYLRHTPMYWYSPDGQNYTLGKCQNLHFFLTNGLGQTGYGSYNAGMTIDGSQATFSPLSLDSITFTSDKFEEVESEDFYNIFGESGTYNVSVKSIDPIPYNWDYNTAYNVLGSKTGILTGVCEIIGYSKI